MSTGITTSNTMPLGMSRQSRKTKTRPSVFSSLLWKDACLIKSLMLTTSSISIASYVMLFIYFQTGTEDLRGWDEFAMVIWCIPFLFAFGMPALLVGTEEESGSLRWLRTLPLARHWLIGSKLVVGLIALVIFWIVSSIGLHVVLAEWLEKSRLFIDLEFYLNHWWTFHLFYPLISIQFFVLGLITSYLFRSPIASLLAVLPLGFGWLIGTAWLAGERDQSSGIASTQQVVVCIGLFLMSVAIQHWLGLRRLRSARVSHHRFQFESFKLPRLAYSTIRDSSEIAMRLDLRLPVPRMFQRTSQSAARSRPSPFRALLWQSIAQQASVVVVTTILSLVVFALADRYSRDPFVDSWVGICLFVALIVVGCMTFYPDAQRRQHLFFAERGLATTKLWLTRLALPLCACFVIAFAAASPLGNTSTVFAISLTVFSIAVLTSMWVTRPIFAFFATPAVLALPGIPAAFLFDLYPEYFGSLALVSIPVLFASWRLLGDWASGDRNWKFHARATAYLMLGLLFCSGFVFGHRILSIPPAMPEWRESMLATPSLKPLPQLSLQLSHEGNQGFQNWLDEQTSSLPEDERERATKVLTLNHDYLEARNRFGPFNGRALFENFAFADRFLIAADMVERTVEVRQAVVDGLIGPQCILTFIEADEILATQAMAMSLQQITLGQDTPSTRDQATQVSDRVPFISERLPTASLLRDSRRIALTHEWKSYQRQSWWLNTPANDRSLTSKTFAGVSVFVRRNLLSMERLRTDRYVDLATRETLTLIEREKWMPISQFASHSTEEGTQALAQEQWRNVFPHNPKAFSETWGSPIGLGADWQFSLLKSQLTEFMAKEEAWRKLEAD